MAHQRKVHHGTGSINLCSCGCGTRKNIRRRFAPGHSFEFRTRQIFKSPERGRPVTSVKKPDPNAWKPEPGEFYKGYVDAIHSTFYFAALSEGERCFISFKQHTGTASLLNPRRRSFCTPSLRVGNQYSVWREMGGDGVSFGKENTGGK